MTDTTLDAILSELRRRLEDIYGPRLERVLLYGSQARGDAEPGSDIDVMIVLAGSVSPGEEIARVGTITAEISLDHEVVISCIFVSDDRYASDRSPLLLNVRREGVAI